MLLETAEILPFRVSSERRQIVTFNTIQFLKRQTQSVLCFAGSVPISHVDIKSKGQAHVKIWGF